MDESYIDRLLKNAKSYGIKPEHIKKSTKKNKKFAVYDVNNDIWVHFGDSRYSDYLEHQNDTRKKSYLKRASNIKGNWKTNKYSPNNLAINLLWT